MTPAQALAQALLQSVWQLAVIGLLADLIQVAMRARSPAQRHAAGMVSLMAMLLLPIATFIDCLLGAGEPWLAGALILVDLPAALTRALHDWGPALWLAGAGVMLVRHALGLAWLRGLERASSVLPPEWEARLEALRLKMDIGRAVLGRVADGVSGAFTAGVIRPVLWLPAALLARLPAGQIDALLAHELAHIRRLDWLCNGIQTLAESLLFFHPALWWLSREVRQQRELACDELAVAAGVDPLVLAQALAAAVPAPSRLALAAGGGELKRRVARLLGRGAERPDWRAPAMLVLLLVTSVVVGRAADLSLPRWLAPPLPVAPAAPPAPPVPPPPPEPPA
jgi:Zn-dependent protease with chaperone function